MADITKDFSKFGQREREMASELLSAYGTPKDDTKLLGQGITVFFNPNSGYVFLSDEDYNVAIIEGDRLVDFITCPECGHEATLGDFLDDCTNDCCEEYHSELV